MTFQFLCFCIVSKSFHWTENLRNFLIHMISEAIIFEISDAFQHPQLTNRTYGWSGPKLFESRLMEYIQAYNSLYKEPMFGDFFLIEYLQIDISTFRNHSESSFYFRWLRIPFLEGPEFLRTIFFKSLSSITSKNKW